MAAADQVAAVRAMAAHQAVVGVVWHGARRAPPLELPRFDTVARALDVAEQDVLCVLAPYRSLAKDLECALDAGISCLCAGPPETSETRVAGLLERAAHRRLRQQWGGLACASPSFRRLLELRQRPSFGQPVYLRWVAGNGRGPVRAWWALRDLLCGAVHLLASPPSTLWVTAVRRRGPACHATATLSTASGATAQLAICPQYLPGAGEALLLGTGGLLEADGEPGLRFAGQGTVSHGSAEDVLAEPGWLAGFAAQPAERAIAHPQIPGADRPLLAALRQALSSGQPIAVTL